MLYQNLKLIVKGVEQHRGLTTIAELKTMHSETRDDRMEIAIRLIRLIDGLKFPGVFNDMDKQIPFNRQSFNQSLATATSFHLKPEMSA